MSQGSTPYVRRESMLSLQEHTGERATPRVGGYRVLKRLATGGTCDVLLARAEGPHGFGRNVVLKLLLSKFSGDEAFAKMFAREAAAYARLDHPSIVRLFDFFSLDGQLVMVLEFVDGLTLARLQTLARAANQDISDAAAMFIAQRIFSAIAAAHSAKDLETGAVAPVIHRDVNPTNVLIPWDGHVKITDFGIAKVAGITSDTQAGLIKGTYGYMAPEQVKGEVVTVRADVYAAAIVLWEMFVKRPALMRDELPEMELLRAMAEPRLASLDALRPDLDRRVREVMRVALDPDARKRLISAAEIVAVLRAAAPSEEGRERLVALMERVRPPPSTSPSFTGSGLTPSPAAASIPGKPPVPTKQSSSTTQIMNERPPLPKPEAPPRTMRFGSSTPAPPPAAATPPAPPTQLPKIPPRPSAPDRSGPQPLGTAGAPSPGPMRAQQQSVGTMSAAIEAAVAAAIDGMPTASSMPSEEVLAGMREGAPDTVSEKSPGQKTTPDPTEAMARSSLASLLEPEEAERLRLSTAPPILLSSVPPESEAVVHDPFASGLDRTVSMQAAPRDPAIAAAARVAAGLAPTEPNAPPIASSQPTGASTMPLDFVAPTPPPPLLQSNPPMLQSAPPIGQPTTAPLMAPLDPMRGRQATNPGESARGYAPPTNRADLTAPQKIPAKKGGTLGWFIAVGLVVGVLAGLGAAYVYKPALVASYLPGTLPTAKPSSSAIATATASASTTTTASASTSASATTTTSASATTSATPIASASAMPSASAAPIASGSSAPPAAPSASAPATPPATPATSTPTATDDVPSDTAEVSTALASPHHRIFVDGEVKGETPGAVRVTCGKHTVKIGGGGKPQDVDVACGKRVTIGDKY